MTARWRALLSRRRVASAAVAAACLAAAVLGRGRTAAGDWVAAHREDLVLGVEVSGVLRAADSSRLGPVHVADLWEFKISFMAPEGSKVTKGQPVLRFDTTGLQNELQAKVAERDEARKRIESRQRELELAAQDSALATAEAEAALRRATLKVERPEEIVSSKEVRQVLLDRELAGKRLAYLEARAELDGKGAEAQLQALRSLERRAALRVATIEDAIAKLSLPAPRDGSVIYLTNWREEKKKVGDPCWLNEGVLEIPDLRVMVARGEVDEADAGEVAEGQRVTLRLDAMPDVEVLGKVAQRSRTVERKSWQNPAKIMRVDIALARTDPESMRPGMRFRGQVETRRVRDALVVPAQAVFPTPDGPVVYRKGLTGPVRTPVTLGARNSELVEIASGLAEGEEVSRHEPPTERPR